MKASATRGGKIAKQSTSNGGGDTGSSSSGRPSDRLNPRTIDPFEKKTSGSKSSSSTGFSAAYNRQEIPCRLVHGSVRHRIEWTTHPIDLHFNPLILYLAEGLQETAHPFNFLSVTGFASLLESEGAREKTEPLLASVAPFLRNAMRSSDGEVFLRGVSATEALSNTVGESLNPHLKVLLQPLSSRVNDRKHKATVMTLLTTLSENGGRDATLAIKNKIPTFCGQF